MLILSIDPSETSTGLVLISDGNLTEHATLKAQEAIVWLRQIPVPDVVLLERPAQGLGANATAIAAWKILDWTVCGLFSFAQIISIGPGEWKPVIRRQKPTLPTGLQTVHEKDAYKLFCYWRVL